MVTRTTKKATTTKKVTRGSAAAPADITTLAAQAEASIAGMVATIPLDNVTKTEATAARVANVVPTAAMSIAANVLQQNPTLFTTFDPSVIEDALAYEQAVGPLLAQVQLFAKRLASTMQSRKGAAAKQTLSLYAALKALSRSPAPPALAAEEAKLAGLLVKKHTSRATSVTAPETAKAVRAIRATKVATKKAAVANQAAAAFNQAAAMAQTDTASVPVAAGTASATPPSTSSVPPPAATH